VFADQLRSVVSLFYSTIEEIKKENILILKKRMVLKLEYCRMNHISVSYVFKNNAAEFEN
jgi:hypothetical protein